MEKSQTKTDKDKRIIFAIAKSRVMVQRIFGFLVLLIFIFTGNSFSE